MLGASGYSTVPEAAIFTCTEKGQTTTLPRSQAPPIQTQKSTAKSLSCFRAGHRFLGLHAGRSREQVNDTKVARACCGQHEPRHAKIWRLLHYRQICGLLDVLRLIVVHPQKGRFLFDWISSIPVHMTTKAKVMCITLPLRKWLSPSTFDSKPCAAKTHRPKAIGWFHNQLRATCHSVFHLKSDEKNAAKSFLIPIAMMKCWLSA